MSSNYDNQIKEIEKSRENIAYAISMAVANGKKEEAQKYYYNFLDILANDTQYFFLEKENIFSAYENKVLSSIKELSDFIGEDLSAKILNPQNAVATAKAVTLVGAKIEKNESERLYDKRKEKYSKLGINYYSFKKIYDSKGLEGVAKLDELVKKVNSTLFMSRTKNFLSVMGTAFTLPAIHKTFGKLSENYGVKNLDDLLILNTEIDSFFVDEKTLDGEARKIVEENKKNFRKRIGAKEDYIISEKEANELKKDISKVYDYNLYREVFQKTNINDFFSRYGYEVNEHNLKNAFNFIFCSDLCTGFCSQSDLGDGEMQYIFLNSNMVKREVLSEHQDDLIIHESIHALEKKQTESKHNFCSKYRNVNEAMTEYLSRKSLKYLNNSILSVGMEKDDRHSWFSIYDPMLPLVEKLSQSNVWESFLKVKFEGDVKAFEKELGLDNIKKIAKCFDNVAKTENDHRVLEENLVQLDNVLNNMKKQIKHN